MYKVLKRTCWAIVLPIRSFLFPCPRCRRRRGLLKVPNDVRKPGIFRDEHVRPEYCGSRTIRAKHRIQRCILRKLSIQSCCCEMNDLKPIHLRVACIMDGRRKSLYSLKVALCIESCNYVKQCLLLAREWDTGLSQATPSITSRFLLRHQIGLLGGERHWESQASCWNLTIWYSFIILKGHVKE